MEEDDRQALLFGDEVKRRRLHARLSLDDLAARSGVSRAMLSKVERGEKSPTLPVASRIAQGLDASLSALLGSDATPARFDIVRADKRLTFRDPESGFVRELLATAANGLIEVVRHELPVGATSGDLPAYPGGTSKCAVVERGELEIRIGEQSERLLAGDTVAFAADSPHSFTARGHGGCAYMLIISRSG